MTSVRWKSGHEAHGGESSSNERFAAPSGAGGAGALPAAASEAEGTVAAGPLSRRAGAPGRAASVGLAEACGREAGQRLG
jgi:hypothetical protein